MQTLFFKKIVLIIFFWPNMKCIKVLRSWSVFAPWASRLNDMLHRDPKEIIQSISSGLIYSKVVNIFIHSRQMWRLWWIYILGMHQDIKNKEGKQIRCSWSHFGLRLYMTIDVSEFCEVTNGFRILNVWTDHKLMRHQCCSLSDWRNCKTIALDMVRNADKSSSRLCGWRGSLSAAVAPGGKRDERSGLAPSGRAGVPLIEARRK